MVQRDVSATFIRRSRESSTDVDWRAMAACRRQDPDIFFPSKEEDASQAKAVCCDCHVRKECLDFALDSNQTFGVWGGLSEMERRGDAAAKRLVPAGVHR